MNDKAPWSFLVRARAVSPERTIWTRFLQFLFLVALSFYLGGFTFYSAVVIPILHERLESSIEAGLITQRVTDALNLLGVITLSLGWCVYCLGAARPGRGDRGRRWEIGSLMTSSVCLVVLLMLHRVLDRKLASSTLVGFYPYHRAYLWTSTVQWLANLALLSQSAGVFTSFPDRAVDGGR
jgi:hypothetical protein